MINISRFFKIDDLYSYFNGYKLWAYSCIDLDTGEHRYFRIENNRNNLIEFKLDDINNDLKLRQEINSCPSLSIDTRVMIPKELREKIEDYIDKHTKFNVNNNLPVNYININKQHLLVQFKKSKMCSYDYVLNTIFLKYYREQWNLLDVEDKENAHISLIHELGHMKARHVIFDEKNKQIHFGTGFRKIIIDLTPTYLSNGDVLYFPINTRSENHELRARTLEEIINELECQLIFPNYKCSYPEYGRILNNLCDNRLLLSRYTNGFDEYYNSLCQIIADERMANELLDEMTDSIYGDYLYPSNDKAIKLLKKYEEKKMNN